MFRAPGLLIAVSLPSDLVVPGGSPVGLSDLADRPPGGQRSTAGIIQLVLGLPLDSFNMPPYCVGVKHL